MKFILMLFLPFFASAQGVICHFKGTVNHIEIDELNRLTEVSVGDSVEYTYAIDFDRPGKGFLDGKSTELTDTLNDGIQFSYFFAKVLSGGVLVDGASLTGSQFGVNTVDSIYESGLLSVGSANYWGTSYSLGIGFGSPITIENLVPGEKDYIGIEVVMENLELRSQFTSQLKLTKVEAWNVSIHQNNNGFSLFLDRSNIGMEMLPYRINGQLR